MPDSEFPSSKFVSGKSSSPLLPSFEELSQQRKLLQEFCFAHIPSLSFFLPVGFKNLPIFKLDDTQPEPTEFRHITSTATCYASIAGCPDQFRPEKKDGSPDFNLLGKEFSDHAIALELGKWVSDGAAHIYCSCRGLPYVLSRLERWDAQIEAHLGRIFYQLDEDPSRFAIGEAAEAELLKDKPKERAKWYKPNAYHTYWALRVVRALQTHFSKEFNASRHRPSPERLAGMRMWARQQLGIQVALHSAESSVLDSDQLAWSLATLISQPQSYRSRLPEQDLLRQALKCLFNTQETVGTWRHYAPLFHYPNVGNAYCYVFETFAAILLEALKPEAEFVRTCLKQYFPQLVKLWQYAVSTAEGEKGIRMWSSGHRINPGLESWATASVFDFAQAFRQLVGIWTREAALPTLNYKIPFPTPEKAKKKLLERSKIWTSENLDERLWTMFINPVSKVDIENELDPDRPLIAEAFPRAAIFFGPPGTSKTKLVSAIAGAIGWKYIELHPSHFVAEGLPNVQHTADVIFSKLMELDHAVVLFDEIDELVRERDIEPDQFGRFLTTSMLPRLAELWKARKIMYFVATNHIEYFDRAVTRSERFDAIIFISPPSFEVKKKRIVDLLRDEHGIKATFHARITEARVSDVMRSVSCESTNTATRKKAGETIKNQMLPPKLVLAKFAMLRWDELDELALHLRSYLRTARTITEGILKKALSDIRDTRSRGLGEYCRFQSDPRDYERFDASRKAVWIVEKIDGFVGGDAAPPEPVYKTAGSYVVEAPVGTFTNIKVPGYTVELSNVESESGRVRLKPKKRKP